MSKNVNEDFELVRRAKKGEEKAFEKILQKYRKSVYYMLLKMVKNADDADDLTQEAFAKAFKSINKFDPKYAFSTWLFRIATNNCIDFIRKKRVQTISIENPSDNDDDNYQLEIRDPDDDPNEALLRKQRKKYLKIAMEKLPEKYQMLLELRYFQELSYQEVADELDLPLGTVKAQLFRARELLQEELGHIEKDI